MNSIFHKHRSVRHLLRPTNSLILGRRRAISFVAEQLVFFSGTDADYILFIIRILTRTAFTELISCTEDVIYKWGEARYSCFTDSIGH